MNIGHIVYENAAGTLPSAVTFSYSLSANGFGTLSSGSTLISSCGGSVSSGPKIIPDAMIKQLELAASESTASSWIFGSSSAIQGTLSYTATSPSSNSGNRILNKKDIKVYFIASQSCSSHQVSLDSNIQCKDQSPTPITPPTSGSPSPSSQSVYTAPIGVTVSSGNTIAITTGGVSTPNQLTGGENTASR